MTRTKSTIIALTASIALALGFNGVLASAAQAQQFPAQAYADAKYQEYVAAHEMTFRNQQSGPDVYNYYLGAEQNAWNTYTQANWAAQQESLQWQQYVANETARVTDYIRNHLYDRVDRTAYANNANYRVHFDSWVRQEAARSNAYLVDLANSGPGSVRGGYVGGSYGGGTTGSGGRNDGPVSCSAFGC